jgi:glycosyltransferase involved in cell wall biosynthesis
MSTVAIVMTTYNGEKYVGEQIESILDSNFQDFELYIYDDGSKDSTMSILRGYEAKYPDKIHAQQNDVNLGVTMNFLQALGRTTTDYIMFCDQDDYWKSNKISLTLKRMRNIEVQQGKDEPIAVFTDAQVVNTDLSIIHNSFMTISHLNPTKTDLPHLLMENKLIGCTVMVNSALRRILQGHKLPKEAKFHDWWVGLIASSMGKIVYINEATLLYRQHGGNVVGGTGFASYIKNRVHTLQKQKDAILALERQAAEFLEIYEDIIPNKERDIIRCFANLHQVNFFRRRKLMLQYGFLKSGIVRNLGLMTIV